MSTGPRIVKRPLAREDLIGIWRCTYQEWGEQQAGEYLDEIDAGITQLRDHPKLGRDRSEVRQGYRSLRIIEHVIFYTVAGDSIRIVRVLHVRMEPGSHL